MNDAAYVLYTSGTTGMPKGVVVENRNVCHYVRAFGHEFHVGPGDVMLQYSVCTFDIFVEEVFTTLLSGATLAIPDGYRKNNLRALVRFVEEHNVTEISGFPYLLLELNRLKHIPSSLRLLISGGDVLRARYISNLIDKVEIYNTYGPSETTVCASYFRCTDIDILMKWRMEVLRCVFSLPEDADTGELERQNRLYYEQNIDSGGHIACIAHIDGKPAGCTKRQALKTWRT